MLIPLCSPEIFTLFQRRRFDLAAVNGKVGGVAMGSGGGGGGEESQQEQEAAHLRADTPTFNGKGSGPSRRQRSPADLAPPTFTDEEKTAGPIGGLWRRLGGGRGHLIVSLVTVACATITLTPPTAC